MIECDDFDLDTGFFLIFMHSLSVVAVPLNVLSIFCIVYKSTKQMGSYKWYLLIYQVSSTVFDFIYLALTLPVIFFPIPMGYPASWIAPWISITTHLSVLLVVNTGSFFGATIVSLFIYRCHVVTPTLHFSRISSHGHVYKNAILFPSFAIPVLITSFDILPDQAEARTWVEKEYTCARSALSVPRLQIFIPYKLRGITITIAVLACIAFVIVISCVIVSFNFLRENGSMSQRTKEMQKRFLLYLSLQVSVPILSMVVPITSLMYIFGTTNNTPRGFGDFMLALLGSHGCLAATTLILCNAPYREFATTLITIRWRRKKPTVAVSRSGGTYSNQQQIL